MRDRGRPINRETGGLNGRRDPGPGPVLHSGHRLQSRQRTAVLQHDDTFALFDTVGDVGVFVAGEQGLYHEGTRYLSRFQLRMNGQRPLLLSARVKDDNELFGADLTNPDIPLGDGDRVLARDVVHLFRGRFLWDATWHERLRLWNYSRQPVRVSLTFDIDADFADIFEVRGMRASAAARAPRRSSTARRCGSTIAAWMASADRPCSSGARCRPPRRQAWPDSSTSSHRAHRPC